MLSILIPNRDEQHIQMFISECEKILPAHEIIISNDTEGKGKGWALREALIHSKGDYIAFIDGDGEIEPRMLLRLLPFMDDFDAVVGSKRIAATAPLRRKIMTRLTRLWFKFLYGVRVDTQTGIKLFRRRVLNFYSSYWESNGFIFDVEILANLQKKHYRIIEIPVEAEIRKQLSFKQIFRILGESLWLKYRLSFHAKK
jgi:glycosyltransferase involved in cell wall biosynthesis